MSFESIRRNAQVVQRRVILVEPDALRECADRLERAARQAIHGDSVMCDLTSGVAVLYKPMLYLTGHVPTQDVEEVNSDEATDPRDVWIKKEQARLGAKDVRE